MKPRTQKPTFAELRALGVSKAYASELSAGKKTPSLALAQRIEGTLGYPSGAWRLASEEAA